MIKYLFIFNYMLLLYACYTDIINRRIKNKTVIIVCILSLAIGFIQHDLPVIKLPLVIIVVGFFLSLLGLLGFGDVKLIFALSFSLSNELIGHLILMTAASGFFVGIIALCWGGYKRKRMTVPYGVAITLGYLLVTAPKL